MADIRITFSSDRAAAAERLREAVSAAGYPVALARISDVEELIESEDRQQGATILIWSRSLVLSALRQGLLRQLRKQRGLIEVSPDGVGPDGGEGESHAILISGWRGQPFHPGWQRLASELKRLCGAPRDSSEASIAPGYAELPAAPPVPAKARAPGWRPGAGTLALALLAAIVMFGAGYATATWLRNGALGTWQQSPPETQIDEATAAPVAADPRPLANVAAVSSLAPPPPARIVAAEPADLAPLSAAASSTAAPPSSNTREGSKPAPRMAKKESETRRGKANSPVRGETKRYSRRNSKVMRLFCQGSGRSTPQCRTFLRETRGSRR